MSYFSYYFSTFHHFAPNLVAKVKIKQFAKWERFVYKRQNNRKKSHIPKKGSNFYPLRMNSDVVYGSMFYYYFHIDSRMKSHPKILEMFFRFSEILCLENESHPTPGFRIKFKGISIFYTDISWNWECLIPQEKWSSFIVKTVFCITFAWVIFNYFFIWY